MPATPFEDSLLAVTRRELLGRLGSGVGAVALASLLHQDGLAVAGQSQDVSKEATATGPLAPQRPHFAPRAKSVIFLHMVGGPSQLELFENKPELVKHSGKPCPSRFLEGKKFAFLRGHPKLLGTRAKFAQRGECGTEISDYLPHLAKVADDIAVVKTLRTEEINHAPAQLFFQTGFGRFGRPSLGSWTIYGLGSACQNLPAFVVLQTGKTAGAGNSLWGSGFLPTVYQGIPFRNSGDPVLFLSNPPGVDRADRRQMLESIAQLNQQQYDLFGDPEITTRISQYEMAFRMQRSVPELVDLSGETAETLKLYGATPGKPSFATHCLLARRLVERGVRFVQLYNASWDHHGGVFKNLPGKCREVDQAMAALVTDLKRKGLLEETLVIWGGEFGRTPMLQGSAGANAGRDHHKEAFCMWMAGGGIKPGIVYGQTDELGYFPVADPMHVHDLHATILHLLGLDHTKLTFQYQGRQFRLTDVAGQVAQKLIASS